MSIIRIDNPMMIEVLNTLKRTDVSQFEVYSAVNHATTILAGEIAKTVDFTTIHINTFYGGLTTKMINKNMTIVSRIRSGLPMIESLRDYFKCGYISYILLDQEVSSKVLYSSVGNINKFKKVIYAEPFLIDMDPVKVTMQHLFSKGALQKNISIVILAASKEMVEEIDCAYPDVNVFLGQEDDFFENFLSEDRYYDDIGGVIYGDSDSYNAKRIKYYEL